MANVQVNLEFIPNKHGGQNLVYQGYKFRIKRRRNANIHWRCCVATCPATINTTDGLITTHRDIHNHPPNQNRVVVDKFLASLKEKVKCNSRPMPSIYQEELNGKLSDDTL